MKIHTWRFVRGDPNLATLQIIFAKFVSVSAFNLDWSPVDNIHNEVVFLGHVLRVVTDHHRGNVIPFTLVYQV